MKSGEVERFLRKVTDEVPQVAQCATFFYSPDLPERTRFQLGAKGLIGIYSNGSYTVKFRVETTAETDEECHAVLGFLNEWLGNYLD